MLCKNNRSAATVVMNNSEIIPIDTKDSLEKGSISRFTVEDEERMAALLKTRLDFVTDRGWLDEEVDHDIYDDSDRGTSYFMKQDKDGGVELGMRITPIDSVETCLSYEMLQPVCSADNKAALLNHPGIAAAAQRNELSDLTRLVTPPGRETTRPQLYQNMVEVISRAIKHEQDLGKKDPIWVFSTTSVLRRMFNDIGVLHEVLVGGKLPGDAQKTFFCMTRPYECLRYVQQHEERFASTLDSVARVMGARAVESDDMSPEWTKSSISTIVSGSGS